MPSSTVHRAALVRSAMLAADLVLIAIQPSALDVWATQAVLGLICEASGYKPQLRGIFVVNRRVIGTRIAREVRRAIGDLGIPALNASLAQRVISAETAGTGMLAAEIDPHAAAAREVAEVTAELLEAAS
jgi:chromosome partitioning protein